MNWSGSVRNQKSCCVFTVFPFDACSLQYNAMSMLSLSLSVSLSLSLFVSVSASVYLSVCLSVCLSPSSSVYHVYIDFFFLNMIRLLFLSFGILALPLYFASTGTCFCWFCCVLTRTDCKTSLLRKNFILEYYGLISLSLSLSPV